jgi:ubiquinone/menaquinone biosynthesis C-methylase UbiE
MSEEIRYDRHEEEWEKILTNESRNKIGLTWLNQHKTLDRWRHDRMYDHLKPLISLNNELSWLTVGDGRYGTDANSLFKLGATKVMCTDISDKLLKIGSEKGFIKDYSEQNAECLTFDNDQFDFTLCKEAYHHFPRPHIALHEMLRVSKFGVVLIEPCDSKVQPKLLNRLLPSIKKILGKSTTNDGHGFETVGNYVFTVSERELEKFQLGMHRRYLAYLYVNDYYEPGFEFINIDTTKKADIRKIRKVKLLIKLRDLLCRLNLISPGILCAILFKEDPSSVLIDSLKSSGWQVKKLPRNPYL